MDRFFNAYKTHFVDALIFFTVFSLRKRYIINDIKKNTKTEWHNIADVHVQRIYKMINNPKKYYYETLQMVYFKSL